MKTEFTISKEFILEAHKSACDTWKSKIKNEFPDAFKNELEVGKWYEDPRSELLMFVEEINAPMPSDTNSIKSYGFSKTKEWLDSDLRGYYYFTQDLVLSDPKKVESALIEEAKKRGFKKGITIERSGINGWKETDYEPFSGAFRFIPNLNILECDNGNGYIFKNGIWATLIKEKLTIEQRIEALEKKIK